VRPLREWSGSQPKVSGAYRACCCSVTTSPWVLHPLFFLVSGHRFVDQRNTEGVFRVGQVHRSPRRSDET
jgi:hypothetical protein